MESKQVVFLIILETRFQDGRSGLQGVSKGCQRVVPGDPNVAPAVSNVAHGAVKVAAGVSKGAQRVPKAWPRAPKRCPREPKGCPRCAQGSLRVPTSATTTNKHTNEQKNRHDHNLSRAFLQTRGENLRWIPPRCPPGAPDASQTELHKWSYPNDLSQV